MSRLWLNYKHAPEYILMSFKRSTIGSKKKFIFSLSQTDFSQSSNCYLGKAKSNFSGKKLKLYSKGAKEGSNNKGETVRKCLALIDLVN